MATEAGIVTRVRNELGDFAQPFRSTYRGDGHEDQYDLPATNVSGVRVTLVADSTVTDLVETTDYTVQTREGLLDLVVPPVEGAVLMVEGSSTGLFTDDELASFVNDALLQHTQGATSTSRYRDANGFIRYDTRAVDLTNLPEVEEVLVAILGTVEALWALSTDAATDIDITTAEGTFVGRSQRYAQIRSQIDVLTEKYHTLSQQLNVGLFRIEMSNLRRVSRTTGRLVPLYIEREFDDTAYPVRITPPIDARYGDNQPTPGITILGEDVEVVDLQVKAGDTFAFDIDFGFDLTGSTVASAVSSIQIQNAAWLQYFTVTVTDALTGKATLSLTPYQTTRLGRNGGYDVQVTDPSGNVTTYVKGRVQVDGQITPDGSIIPATPTNIPWNTPGWTVNNHG